MEDYNKVLEATSVAENANGVAAEKMTVYNESLEAAQNRLTASVQQFAQDSNLDRTLALAYDGLSKVVEILNILLNKIPVLSPLIKALGVALATTFAAGMIQKVKDTSGAISEMIKALTGVQTTSGAVVGVIPALKAALTGLTGVFAGTTTVASAFGSVMTALGGPIGVAVAALGALLVIVPSVSKALSNLFPNAEQRIKSVDDAFNSAQTEVKEAKKDLDDVNAKIKEINEKGTLTLADKNEKQKLEEQRDILKDILKYKQDIANQKLGEQQEEYGKQYTDKYSSDKIDASKQYAYITQAEDSGKYYEYYDAESASVEQLLANLQKLGDERRNLNKDSETYGATLTKNNELTKENTDALKSKAIAIGEDISKMQELDLTDTDYYKNAVDQFNQLQVYLDPSNWTKIEVKELIDVSGVKGKLQKASDDAKVALTKAASDSSSAVQKEAVDASNNLSKTIKDSVEQIADDIKGNTNLKNAFAEALNVDPNDIDEIANVIEQEIQEAYGIVSQSANDAADALKNANGEVKTASEVADELGEREVSLGEKTKSLSDAYNAMIDKNKITKSQMTALIKQYPELTNKIEVHNGVIRIETSVLQDMYDTVIQGEESYLTAQINQTNAAIQGAQTRIKTYEDEAKALKLFPTTQKQQQQQNVFAGVNIYGSTSGLPTLPGTGQNFNIRQQQYEQDKKDLDAYLADLAVLQKQLASLSGDKLAYTGSKSGKSDADKAAKEFEDAIKEKVQNLKSIVELYSENANWDDPTVIKEFQDRYDKILNEVINDPKARKVLADMFNLNIKDMPVEQQIQELTTLWQKQAGTIQESYQKLLKNLAKEDLSSAKAVIEKYKDGIYGAWSSDEALNAAKADYQKFIDKITNDADYRAAMAEALNLGDISGEPVEKQIEAVVNALLKSTGKLDDAQQDLYDEASKNIKALQDEIEDMIDTAIDLLEKAGDFLFDMLGKISDRYDAQIDNLDKISDELDDQKDAFEDKIDKQKELLKLQKEEMDNADELAEKNKSIADIDAQLMELQYDNSAEAQAKRLKLLDERAEKEKDLADWQKDNDYNAKIDALDKEKSEYEKTIEAEKKAIEAQKQTLQDAQKQFETTLGNIQNGFNTFIKILSSDLVKNLISKALINTGSDTVTNLLTGYNKLFGSGIDTDVTGKINAGYKSLNEIGGKITNGLNLSGVSKNINSLLEGIVKNFGNFSSGISRIVQPGIQSVSDIFSNFGNVLRNSFSLDWNGITSSMGSGLKVVSSTFSGMFNPIAKGASAIGDAIGAGITGFFPGIFTALGTLVTTVGTAMSGVLNAIATAMSSIPVAGWAIAAAAVAGAVALVGSIAAIVAKTKSAKVTQPTQSFAAKKHHTGADYVKKENPALDKMLGLNDDETVSILKVGEAVVPTWANNATSSSSSNKYTGSPFGSAVDSAVKSARANTQSTYRAGDSSISISIPINIQGDADATTVKALRQETDNIVNKVLRTINNQTRIGGYRNVKAATI